MSLMSQPSRKSSVPPGQRGRPTLWLHIGAMKTGTTYLQQLLYANRDALRSAGLALPGEDWSRQVRGVQDVMRLDRRDRHIRRQSAGAWARLLEEVAGQSVPSLISVEFLSFCGRLRGRHIMDTLATFDVRVVLTVRDMAGLLPSQWQTLVHNQATFSWADYLASVPEPGVPRPWELYTVNRARRHFQRTQNVPRMLAVWADLVAAECLHVVAVPGRPGAPDELWRRFADVVGVDPATASERPQMTNPSLGHASTELLRLMNRHLRRLPRSEYNWTVKELVALEHLAARAPDEGRARLTKADYDKALRWNALTRDTIAASAARVTGDPDVDLPVLRDEGYRATLPDQVQDPDPEQVLDAADVVARELARLSRRRAARLLAAGKEVHHVAPPRPRIRRRSWTAQPDPAAAAAEDLARSAREAALLLRQLRQERRRGVEA